MSPETAYTDELAHFFVEHASESSYNAYLDRPAVLGLVGDCAGQRVLDVGCSAGHYLEAPSERGARPVGMTTRLTRRWPAVGSASAIDD